MPVPTESLQSGQASFKTNEPQNQLMFYAWTLQGKPLKSLLDLHQHAQIIIVSPENKFKGLYGLDQFGVEPVDRPRQDTSLVHPNPKTWI